MSVAGELGDFDLAGILQLLGTNRATGRLRVTAGDDDVALYLDAGRLVAVASTRLPLRLGRILHQRGLVTDAQLQRALTVQQAEGRRRSLGEILVAAGWVTEAQLAACVNDQCVAALARVLAAGTGAFVYTSGVRPPARGPVLPLGTQTALLEAFRRVDELGQLRALLPPDVRLALRDAGAEHVVPAGGAEGRIVAALRAGVRSLPALVELVQVDEPTLLRALIGLRERGIVEATPPDGGLPPAASVDDDADRAAVIGFLIDAGAERA